MNDFEEFSDLNITYSDFSSEVEIGDDLVSFEVDFPISVSKGENVYTMESFEIDIPVRLEKILNFSKEIINTERNGSICISCIYNLASEEDFYVHISDSITNGSVVFLVRDKQSKINGQDYLFYFASKYMEFGENEI